MKIGRIYINGQIGSSTNEAGETVKGVELQDVILQANANKDCERTDVYITSHGGNVLKGKAIAKFIASIPNAYTIAEKHCSSIATEIHLSVPLERRKIVAGTKYFVHNPLATGVSGNADELIDIAEVVRDFEKDMQAMYCKATGLDREAIAGLMKQETSLTDEQCIALKFASEILPEIELKAVAFLDNPNKLNSFEQMEKSLSDKIIGLFTGLKKELKIKAEETPAKVVALDVKTDKGVLNVASPKVEGVISVDDVCTIDGAAPAEGEYKTEDGTVYAIDVSGKVTAVTVAVQEETVEALKAENEKLKAEVATIKQDTMNEVNALVEAQITAIKASISSNYTPPSDKPGFNKGAKAGEVDYKQQMKDRKATYKGAPKVEA